VNPVDGATVYNVYSGATVVGTSADPAGISVSQGLNDRALTPLTVKAENAGVLWEGNLQGMLKYPEDTPILNAYTDWFRFLNAGLETMRSADHPDYVVHITVRNAVRNALNNNSLIDEDAGKWYKENYEGLANNAMSAILRNHQWVVDNATEERVDTINETLPRIWFNKVAGSGYFDPGDINCPLFNNDEALNLMMQDQFPDITLE